MGTGAVALECRFGDPLTGVHVLAVLDEDRGKIVPITPPGNRVYGPVEAVGSRRLRVSGSDRGEDPHASRRYLVDWRSGAEKEIEGDMSASGAFPGTDPRHQILDLDAASAVSRLCAPIVADVNAPLSIVRIGRWVLQDTDAWRLQRCGSRHVTTAPAGWRDPVIGRDAFAYRSGRRIVYHDLRNGRRRSLRVADEPHPDARDVRPARRRLGHAEAVDEPLLRRAVRHQPRPVRAVAGRRERREVISAPRGPTLWCPAGVDCHMRRIAAVTGALLLLWAQSAAAAMFAPVATSVVALVSDGANAAAYMPTADTVRVLFSRGAPPVTLTAPAGCSVTPSRGGGGLRAVGGGYVLYYCPGAFGTPLAGANGYVVQSLATGAGLLVPGALPAGDSGSPPGFAAIGSQWLGGTITNHQGDSFPFDLRWRTGVAFAWPRKKLSDREVEALDRDRPVRRMCAPLRRSLAPAALGDTQPGVYERYVYERPWGAGIVVHRRAHLLLQRCGSKRHTTLASPTGGIGQLQGKGGVITWVSGSTTGSVLHAYAPRTRRASSTRATDPSLVFAHLGSLLFLSTVASRVGGGDQSPATWTVSAAQAFQP